MEDIHKYEVQVEWTGTRKGMMRSPELDDKVEVATPPEFKGGIPRIWSPEHLFVSAVSSCLMTTFLAIAENSRLDFTGFSCKAVGKLEKLDNRFAITEVMLEPHVTVTAEADSEKALRVLTKAEANCLISNSVKSKIVFNPVIHFTPAENAAVA